MYVSVNNFTAILTAELGSTHVLVGQDVPAEFAFDALHLSIGVVDDVDVDVGCRPCDPYCPVQPRCDLECFMASIA